MYQIDNSTAVAARPAASAAGTAGWFTDGNPGSGVPATILPAEFMNMLMAEFLTILSTAGITPSKSASTQLMQALIQQGLQDNQFNSASATGTSDALIGAFSPTIAALPSVGVLTVYVRAAYANATTTPTFTPNTGVIAPAAIVKGSGVALSPGDIAGAGHWLELQYDQTFGKWVLLNPANGVVGSNTIQSISASVASNALTVGYAGGATVQFRNATLTTGSPVSANIASAFSLVVPTGATLGTVAATQAQLALVLLYNGGAPALGIVNTSGGVNLDETTLLSTTAISASATANNVVYSAAAITNSPFRVLGYINITEAVAGTWATAPTLVQGAGGQAMQSMGSGQTLTPYSVGVSRVAGTTYYNTTNKSINIYLSLSYAYGNNVQVYVNGQNLYGVLSCTGVAGAGIVTALNLVIPIGGSYAISPGGGATINNWWELR